MDSSMTRDMSLPSAAVMTIATGGDIANRSLPP